jgi:hypothetical protein
VYAKSAFLALSAHNKLPFDSNLDLDVNRNGSTKREKKNSDKKCQKKSMSRMYLLRDQID